MLNHTNDSTDFIEKLKVDDTWSFTTGTQDNKAFSHGYHRYPAKFIPQIVTKLITEYTKPGELVCDPFGGCGTTLVQSKIMGRNSVGFDINPIAKLITEAKMVAIEPAVLKKYREVVLNNVSLVEHPPKLFSRRLFYWFDEKSLEDLSRLYASINTIPDKKIRRFYYCTFSHILKNCSRWLATSTKPQLDKNKQQCDVIKTFEKHLNYMTKKNQEFFDYLKSCDYKNIESKMYLRDSTKKLPLENCSVDLIVTSPPYVTSYEYAELHQLSLLWFGNDIVNFKKWGNYVNNYSTFKKAFIGTKVINSKLCSQLNSLTAEKIVLDLYSRDRGLARSVEHYFEDMNKSLMQLHRVLKKTGKIAIIIGNTDLKGVKVKNAEVAYEQMTCLGFKPVEVIKRKITNKLIAPWRDKDTGKFTGKDCSNKYHVYAHEYIIVMSQ